MNGWRRLTAVVGMVTLGTAGPCLAQDVVALPLGSAAPAVTVQDTSGAVRHLSWHAGGRPAVLEFYATWCQICAALLPRLEAAQRRYGHRVDFVVIGVGVDETLASVRSHIEQHPEPFTYYFDNTGEAVRGFNVPATGVIVALDARGRVVYSGAGDDQDLIAVARRAAGAAGRR